MVDSALLKHVDSAEPFDFLTERERQAKKGEKPNRMAIVHTPNHVKTSGGSFKQSEDHMDWE
jgi:hypothetical protein